MRRGIHPDSLLAAAVFFTVLAAVGFLALAANGALAQDGRSPGAVGEITVIRNLRDARMVISNPTDAEIAIRISIYAVPEGGALDEDPTLMERWAAPIYRLKPGHTIGAQLLLPDCAAYFVAHNGEYIPPDELDARSYYDEDRQLVAHEWRKNDRCELDNGAGVVQSVAYLPLVVNDG